MVNTKDYDESADFVHHRKEFELFKQTLSKYTSLKGLTVLDLCAQWGKHLGFIAAESGNVIGCDIVDYIGFFGKDYERKILEYYNKYGTTITNENFELTRMDAQMLAFQNSSFDIVFCINSFEHVPDPEKVLLEIYRVLKPGGYAFISFIPVYFSDVGSHMIDFVKEPWAHLRYSEEEFIEKLKTVTLGTDYHINEFKRGLNKLSRTYFIRLFDKYSGKGRILDRLKGRRHFDILENYKWVGVENEEYMQHENFKLLLGRYAKEDLLFRGMYILLRKKG